MYVTFDLSNGKRNNFTFLLNKKIFPQKCSFAYNFVKKSVVIQFFFEKKLCHTIFQQKKASDHLESSNIFMGSIWYTWTNKYSFMQ